MVSKPVLFCLDRERQLNQAPNCFRARGFVRLLPGPILDLRCRLAHTEFVAALVGNVPHPIYADVDSQDLDARADHLEKVFATLHVYLTAIIADTAQNIPGGTLDRRYVDSLFHDLAADAVGVIRNAAEEMREYENWRAS
jgi:hypothetical protein